MRTKKIFSTNALAEKYNVSREFVRYVSMRGGKTIIAKKIEKDIADIKAIIERETVITV